MPVQAKKLIEDGLANISSPISRVLIVIDALDECELDGRDLIPLLVRSTLGLQFVVKILVTSRPEHGIQNARMSNFKADVPRSSSLGQAKSRTPTFRWDGQSG
jgi:hypothetical protein